MLDNIEQVSKPISKPLDSRTVEYHKKQLELKHNAGAISIAEPRLSVFDRIAKTLNDIESTNVQMLAGGAYNGRCRTSKY